MVKALTTGWNAMETECNRGKVTQGMQKMLRQVITAAMKWMQQTVVFIGKEKTKWGKVKSSTHIQCRWQNILTNLPEVTDQARNVTMLL